MHLDGRTRPRLGTATNRLYRWLAVLFPFSIAGSVLGQGYLFSPPGYPGAPVVPSMGNVASPSSKQNGQASAQSVDQINNTRAYGPLNGEPNEQNPQTSSELNTPANSPAGSQTEGDSSGVVTPPLVAPVESLLRWGSLHLRARASYQFLYATGIHSQPGKDADTITHTFSPGVSLALGPHVNLDYAPTFRFFSGGGFHNTVDHSATMSAGLGYGDWYFGANQSFTVADEPLVQTSGQTETKDYSAGLSAAYQVNDKVSLITSASVGLTFVNGTNNFVVGTNTTATPLSDSQSYSGSESLNYQLDEKISTGLGVTVSYTEQDGGFRSVSENFHGNVGWKPGEKLSLAATVGVEHREFLDSNASDAWNPIYSATISYHVLEPTTLLIYANQSVSSSLFQNQVSETTSVGCGVQQRLLGKLQLSLGFGYTKSEYQDTTTADLAKSRGDEGTSFSAGLSFAFLKHCNFGTFYQYSENTSSATGFGYSSSQIGATLSWTY